MNFSVNIARATNAGNELRYLYTHRILGQVLSPMYGVAKRIYAIEKLVEKGFSRTSAYRHIDKLERLGWVEIFNKRQMVRIVSRHKIIKENRYNKKYIKLTNITNFKDFEFAFYLATARSLEKYLTRKNTDLKKGVRWFGGVALSTLAKRLNVSRSKVHYVLSKCNDKTQNLEKIGTITNGGWNLLLKSLESLGESLKYKRVKTGGRDKDGHVLYNLYRIYGCSYNHVGSLPHASKLEKAACRGGSTSCYYRATSNILTSTISYYSLQISNPTCLHICTPLSKPPLYDTKSGIMT